MYDYFTQGKFRRIVDKDKLIKFKNNNSKCANHIILIWYIRKLLYFFFQENTINQNTRGQVRFFKNAVCWIKTLRYLKIQDPYKSINYGVGECSDLLIFAHLISARYNNSNLPTIKMALNYASVPEINIRQGKICPKHYQEISYEVHKYWFSFEKAWFSWYNKMDYQSTVPAKCWKSSTPLPKRSSGNTGMRELSFGGRQTKNMSGCVRIGLHNNKISEYSKKIKEGN